jgi:hypothetical protein
MHRTNEPTAKTHSATDSKNDYVFRRMMTAIDRVIAGKTKEQRRRDVAWASLWHRHWKVLASETRQALEN